MQMRILSKSKLMALRQCPRRLWLEVHQRELRRDPPSSEARFAVGDLVGELARSLYDPDENGQFVDIDVLGVEGGIEHTAALLDKRVPVFEAGLQGGGARAFVDVLRPTRKGSARTWDLIEVKSSASLKGSHRDDVAIQSYVARSAGLPLSAVKVAYVDTSFVYKGHDDYQGLLREVDLTQDAESRQREVADWIAEGQAVADLPEMPVTQTGLQCRTPHRCGFLDYCRTLEAPVEFPVQWMPRLQGSLREHVRSQGIRDLRDLPDPLLSPQQLRVKTQTLSGLAYFDRAGAQAELADVCWPALFLDFEAVQLAVPIWVGARPYQMFPFQFSLHTLTQDGSLNHAEYLDLSGEEPARRFAEALLALVPMEGTVFVWNASFEQSQIRALAARFADLRGPLQSLEARLFDLLKVVETRYYHPAQKGSWKLKRVLPTLVPDLDHAALTEVNDGHMAVLAYTEAVQPDTPAERRAELDRALRAYCAMDTEALVRIWQALRNPG